MRYFELFEGRDAPLYHGTGMFPARRILEMNTIQGRTFHVGGAVGGTSRNTIQGVSLSRNIRVSRTFGPVVFVLDQAKLAARFKLIPVDFWHRDAYFKRSKNDSSANEAEEFVVGSIPNLDRYLLEIRVQKRTFDLDQKRPECADTIRVLSSHPLTRFVA